MPVRLTPRLATAVPYIRSETPVADIGTDHAYLPIYLCESGVLTPRGDGCMAIAADINRGPVERATAHIAAAGLSACIRTVQTDGLGGLEADDPTDIIIFGMGGELIVSILADAPWVKKMAVRGGKVLPRRLILQPMTHAEKLRAYLIEAGFVIMGETLSCEGERIYQTICAEPGIPLPMTAAELAVGQRIHRRDEEQLALYAALIGKTLRTETAARDARHRAGQNTSETDSLLNELKTLRDSL